MQLLEMGYLNGLLTSPSGRWFTLFFKIVIVLEMVMFARANSDADPMGEPAAGLVCISDCVTCPVICSPPPPPLLYYPSPPSRHSPSPQHSYHSPPPQPPPPTSSPPSPPAYHSPPRSPQAPSWYPIWGTPPPLFIISTLLTAKHPLQRDCTPILTTTTIPQRPLLFLSTLPFLFIGSHPCCLLPVLVAKGIDIRW
ncbi:leucine-rich repeat extensin-like protein 3 [Populus alba x Populus x berolinensis]|nr:leucine-rich repeat extensin-like protein 3 [Populus alba x Populus x berolinensis]